MYVLRNLGLDLSGFSWCDFGAVCCFCGGFICFLSPSPGLQSTRGWLPPTAGRIDMDGHLWFAPRSYL